jgi:hypothetical protein
MGHKQKQLKLQKMNFHAEAGKTEKQLWMLL